MNSSSLIQARRPLPQVQELSAAQCSTAKLKQRYRCLRLILGDQLNHQHSWFSQPDDSVLTVLMEVQSETNYVMHHIQKILAFFLAMRRFANSLIKNKFQVLYLTLDDANNQQSFPDNLTALIEQYQIQRFEYQQPDEYRLDQELKAFCADLSIESACVSSEHFLTEREEVGQFFQGKKTFLMESFYRMMRKQYDVLMDGDKPEGGEWNYDANNRNKCPASVYIPESLQFNNQFASVLAMLDRQQIRYFGEIPDKALHWPVTREQALIQLDFFLSEKLIAFGVYQDAMTSRHEILFHSQISFALNVKLLHPKEVIDQTVAAWHADKNNIDLAQVEGFIRQILGWREYMRGIYWAKMPDYAKHNHFDLQRPLPSWFWSGNTKMKCLQHAISQSLELAYAHHILRLMVIGNFALLYGAHPDAVDAWYLGVYIDAIEWVEMPNTRGMSQYADGGIVGSKPYVASANYINKMSDYCKQCHYQAKLKTGDGACPFNSLYWRFFEKNRSKLKTNPRVAGMYRVWDNYSAQDKQAILEQAETYLQQVDAL